MIKEEYTPQIDEFIDEEQEELHEELIKEEEKKHPLQGLIDFMQKCLEKQDAKGFADVYKTTGEIILTSIAEELKKDEITFTPEDVEYGDGYFIFSFGTNSVLHFHVKECPGWLFGIWFSSIETDESTEENPQYRQDYISVEFFTQYEETIDKFKPSASTITCNENHFYINEHHNLNWWFIKKLADTMKMIMKYPSIMWYRDMNYADMNYEYVTVEEADAEFTEWRLKENARKLMEQENTQKMLDCLRYIYGPVIETGDAFIHDQGSCVSPRYELVMRNIWKDEGQEDSQDGCFGLFEWGAEDWEDEEEDKAYWDKTVKECKDRADALDTYWFNPVSTCVFIVSGEKYYKWKEESEKEEKED